MKKVLLIALAMLVLEIPASPSVYTVKKLPTNMGVTIDADMAKWPDEYFIDSLHSDNNCYFRYSFSGDSVAPAWTREKFQFMVYGAHDDTKVYFAIKMLAEAAYTVGGTDGQYVGDASKIKFNPGGTGTGFFIYINGTWYPDPSCAYKSKKNTALWFATNPTGNGTGLATYEMALIKTTFNRFNLESLKFSIGTESVDNYYMGIGAEYTGNKGDFTNNPWDVPSYYPTFTFSSEAGPNLVSVEQAKVSKPLSVESINSFPNPFKPSTTLSYAAKNNGTLTIYDLNGKTLNRFETKAGNGTVVWNGSDVMGRNVSSGIYIARLQSGKNVFDTRLFLIQ